MEIINHQAYVSLEVAKLLRKAGFDWKVNTCRYNSSPDKVSSNGTLESNFNGYAFQHIAISAPTLDVAQRWLREVREWNVIVDFYENDYMYEYGYSIYHKADWYDDSIIKSKCYEEAQEAGIKKALELILEKGE